jgi:hypothetical protein
VQLEAEGEAGEVGAFIAAVEEQLAGHIRSVERTAQRRARRLQGFVIR